MKTMAQRMEQLSLKFEEDLKVKDELIQMGEHKNELLTEEMKAMEEKNELLTREIEKLKIINSERIGTDKRPRVLSAVSFGCVRFISFVFYMYKNK